MSQELIVIVSIIAAATFSLGFFTGFAVRASKPGRFHITIRTMTDKTDKRRGLANRFVPITHPPCRTCGMPMRLGLIDPLDEPRRERRMYECLPCKDSVNFVITIP